MKSIPLNRMFCYPVCLFFVTGTVLSGADRFVPDFKIKPDDYTVLMAADGQNPGGLRAWINDHRRMQVKNWPLGGQTTWEVEVVEAGDYAVNVLFNHSVKSPLKVAVTAGAARCEGVSENIAHHDWRRFSLPGSLRLAQGRQTTGADHRAGQRRVHGEARIALHRTGATGSQRTPAPRGVGHASAGRHAVVPGCPLRTDVPLDVADGASPRPAESRMPRPYAISM